MSLTVNVVTVCLNEIAGIARCMDSVLAQTHDALEYIVMDGGSSDGTREVIAARSARLAHVESGADRGIYDAMNRALAHCRGDLVYFLNGDDYFFDDGTVARAVAAFDNDPALDILSGRVRFFNTPLVNGVSYARDDFAYRDKLELYRKPIPQQCLFVRRELFTRLGGFDERYRMCADYDWLIGALDRGVRMRQVDDCFCHFDYGGISTTQHAQRLREKRRIIWRRSSPTELLRYALAGVRQRLGRPS